MSKETQTIEIKATPKACFDVICDYEAYPEFLKETKEVVVKKRSGKKAVVTFTVEVIKKFSYTLELTETPPKKIQWRMIEGEMMKSNEGEWALEDLGNKVTQASYSIDVGFGLLVPGAISKILIGSNLPTMLKAFKKRIEGEK